MQKIYTVDEAAELLQLHPKTIRNKIRDGEIEALKVGRQYRISQRQIDQFCGNDEPSNKSSTARSKAYISATIDLDGVSKEENMRITNAIMAVLNSGSNDSHVNCMYYQDVEKMKIIINSNIDKAPELIMMLRGLIQSVREESNS